jgi:PhnB protein
MEARFLQETGGVAFYRSGSHRFVEEPPMSTATVPSAFIPHLVVHDAARAIAFYRDAFGAEEVNRLTEPSGRIGYAELRVGAAMFCLSDEYPELKLVGPVARGGSSAMFSLYRGEVDAFAAGAVAAGATLERPVQDEFYGDRVATLRDPFGHRWSFHKRLQELTPQQMQERFKALF